MDWLNLHTSTLDSAAFLGSTPVQRATWLCVLRYCVGQENSGRIENAREWSNRKWQQLCRVTSREVAAESDLWHWEDGCLVVAYYPLEKEEEVQRNRKNGRLGGRPIKNQVGDQMVNPEGTAGFDSAETEGNRKGREGNRKYIQEGGAENHLVLESAKPVPFPAPEPPAKTPEQLRAEKLFHRRPSTAWGKAELTAWRAARATIEGTHADDWELLEWFYAQPQEKTYARRDLATLLNNWNGEIDRARSYRVRSGGKLSPKYQNAF
jgi:hypothetical protein